MVIKAFSREVTYVRYSSVTSSIKIVFHRVFVLLRIRILIYFTQFVTTISVNIISTFYENIVKISTMK